MAINWMDNFGIYGSGATGQARMLNGVYAEMNGSLLADPDPTSGGETVLRVNSSIVESSLTVIRKVLPTPQATVGVAARYWIPRLPVSTGERPRVVSFRDVSNVILCYVIVDPSGFLEAYDGADTLLGRSDNPVVIANAWQHMETKCVFNSAAGSIEVRWEGVPVLDLALVVTSISGNLCQNVAFSSTGQFTQAFYIKDFIIWDDTGAFNNDFMGSCQVYKIIPDADVALNWSPFPADGIGYNKINELVPDDDTRYIAAPFPLPAGPYRCSLSDLPVTVTSVRGVMPIHRSRKTDGGDGNVQIGLISGGSTGLGANQPITTAYTYWWQVYDADPNGGIGWSRLAVNALNLQLDRTV